VISEGSYRNIDHGYAATIHKSQGATVDRTFVLATGMMDQHLTYVSMTRHRDRADLYAAREDFAPRRNGDESRAPITPPASPVELVETGEAKVPAKRRGCKRKPICRCQNRRRRGPSRLGCQPAEGYGEGRRFEIGDTVTLRKDGVEHVKVEVPVVDPETGEKRTSRSVRSNAMSGPQS
jgi:hypothetical protein